MAIQTYTAGDLLQSAKSLRTLYSRALNKSVTFTAAYTKDYHFSTQWWVCFSRPNTLKGSHKGTHNGSTFKWILAKLRILTAAEFILTRAYNLLTCLGTESNQPRRKVSTPLSDSAKWKGADY